MESAIIATISAVVVAIITQAGTYLRERRARKDTATSVSMEDLQRHNEKQDKTLDALTRAEMLHSMDRISWIAQHYIKKGSIPMFYRRWLNDMHDIYHNDLGGNGDLDDMMQRANALPIGKDD